MLSEKAAAVSVQRRDKNKQRSGGFDASRLLVYNVTVKSIHPSFLFTLFINFKQYHSTVVLLNLATFQTKLP